jgi:hypothetical protein
MTRNKKDFKQRRGRILPTRLISYGAMYSNISVIELSPTRVFPGLSLSTNENIIVAPIDP